MDVRGAISDETLAKVWREMARLRKLRGLTQQELADKAEITQGAISRIENGTLYPSLENQKNLAKVLKFDDLHKFFETMAKLALYPSSMTDWDFGNNELSDKHFKAFVEFKAKAEQQGLNDPKAYEHLMGAYNWTRALNEELGPERPPEEVENITDAMQAVPEHNAVRMSVKATIDEPKNYSLEVEEAKFRMEAADMKAKLSQGIGSLKPKRGRSLLNFGGDKQRSENRPAPDDTRMMPRYSREAPKFDVWGAAHMHGDTADQTPVPPMLINAREPYAMQLNTDHMEPRYNKGDTLYVDSDADPYYGDDVVVRLRHEGGYFGHATRIVKMKIVKDKNENEWQGYGCIATQDEQGLFEEALAGNWSQDDFNAERDGAIDWFFVLRRTPTVADIQREMHDVPDGMKSTNNLVAHAVHVIVGCERKRLSENFERPNPRQKRQMEAAREAEQRLTPYIGYTQQEQDWIIEDLSRDFED